MRSYSIAVLFHADITQASQLEALQRFRQQLPFAAIYLYGAIADDGLRVAIQKMDITLRADESGNRFHVARRMFTEVDADIFIYAGDLAYPADAASAMVHQLVEGRKDMVAALSQHEGARTADTRELCERLYGRRLLAPLSDYRVFSRRFVKSFAAFERGFPIELEWAMHALELDIPYHELQLEHGAAICHPASNASGLRQVFTRLVLNFQARPLKWFGLITAACLLLTLIYKLIFCLEYLGYTVPVSDEVSAIAASSFALMAFVAALSGLLLHSHSHQRRELKRLHFQQHSTL